MSTYLQRPLFGGAILCEIPSAWRDLSDIRQVPDHQEAWQSQDEALLVVEVLERQQVSDDDAAGFFFTDLAESNGVSEVGNYCFWSTDTPPRAHVEGAVLCAGVGFQRLTERNQEKRNARQTTDRHRMCWMFIELCVLRLALVETDLLVTVTRPSSNSVDESPPVPSSGCPWTTDFQHILATLQVRDWELFG